MVERAAFALANFEIGGGLEDIGEVGPRVTHRLQRVHVLRSGMHLLGKLGSHGGSHGAPGAVRVARLDSCIPQLDEAHAVLVAIGIDVDHVLLAPLLVLGILAQPPALEQHGPRAEADQVLGRVSHLRDARGSRAAEQLAGLGHVGREDGGGGHENGTNSLDGFVAHQHVAARRHEHWVDHAHIGIVCVERSTTAVNDLNRWEHASFDGVRAHIGQHRVDLRADRVGIHHLDRLNALRILSSERRDSSRGQIHLAPLPS